MLSISWLRDTAEKQSYFTNVFLWMVEMGWGVAGGGGLSLLPVPGAELQFLETDSIAVWHSILAEKVSQQRKNQTRACKKEACFTSEVQLKVKQEKLVPNHPSV